MHYTENPNSALGHYRTGISLSAILPKLIALLVISVVTCCGVVQNVHAQIDGGGVIDGGTDDGGVFDGGNAGAGGGTGGGNGGDIFGDDFGSVLGDVETEDLRNQGFVGATGNSIQENGFVGPPGDLSGPPLSGDGSFGGGVNDVSLSGGAGGAGGGGGGNQNNNNGFGATGQQGIVKGFEVSRGTLRTNLRPQFSAPQVSGSQIVQRFENRIRRQPNMGGDGNGIQISIEGTTATMVGFAQSAEESNRVERQLRLEPGVYRIENKTQILGR